MTSLRVRKCLLWVTMTIFYIQILKFSKIHHFAAEYCFNMEIVYYNLLLIVVVAPQKL